MQPHLLILYGFVWPKTFFDVLQHNEQVRVDKVEYMSTPSVMHY